MKNSTDPSFSSLPDEIAANCIARVPKSQYPSLSSVSRSFQSLLSSREIHAARSEIGATEPRLYLRLKTGKRRYGWFNLRSLEKGGGAIVISQGEIKTRSNLLKIAEKIKSDLSSVPVIKLSSSSSASAFLAVGSEMYQFGGKGKRCRSVHVFDCRSHTQRRAPNMRVERECAKACLFDGSIYVMGGGCRNRECWGEVFDLKSRTWNKELVPCPSGDDEFDDCKFELLVLGARLYVITEHNKYYSYDPIQGRWLLLLDKVFAGLKRILTLGTVWCVLDNIVFIEFCNSVFWYDVSCGKWLLVEGLKPELMYTKGECRYRVIQLVNYGGKLVIVWVVWPYILYEQQPIPQERTWFAVIRLEKRLTSSGLAFSGEIEHLNYLVHGSYHPLTCLSLSL